MEASLPTELALACGQLAMPSATEHPPRAPPAKTNPRPGQGARLPVSMRCRVWAFLVQWGSLMTFAPKEVHLTPALLTLQDMEQEF